MTVAQFIRLYGTDLPGLLWRQFNRDYADVRVKGELDRMFADLQSALRTASKVEDDGSDLMPSG